jgi:hypothetical protein
MSLKRMLAATLFPLAFVVLFVYGCGSSGGDTSEDTPVVTSVTLAWNAPMTNEDGSPIEDLAGYKLYYGQSSGDYPSFVDTGMNSYYTGADLSPGTWCFAVTAYDTAGNESGKSEEVCTEL